MPISESDFELHTSMEAPSSTMSKAELRKTHKPIMEKKRRARINQSLNEIKSLILEALKKDPSRHSKLEKADILEMAVKHLQNVQRQQFAQAMANDPTVLQKFKAGFNECTEEVTNYISEMEGVDEGLKQRIKNHLQKTISSVEHIAQFNTMAGLGLPFLANSPFIPTLPKQDALGDQNNNPRIQIPQGLQLIPSRLPSGEFAFLVPNSSQLPFFNVGSKTEENSLRNQESFRSLEPLKSLEPHKSLETHKSLEPHKSLDPLKNLESHSLELLKTRESNQSQDNFNSYCGQPLNSGDSHLEDIYPKEIPHPFTLQETQQVQDSLKHKESCSRPSAFVTVIPSSLSRPFSPPSRSLPTTPTKSHPLHLGSPPTRNSPRNLGPLSPSQSPQGFRPVSSIQKSFRSAFMAITSGRRAPELTDFPSLGKDSMLVKRDDSIFLRRENPTARDPKDQKDPRSSETPEVKSMKFPIHTYPEKHTHKDRQLQSPSRRIAEPLCVITNQNERFKHGQVLEESAHLEENLPHGVKRKFNEFRMDQGLLTVVTDKSKFSKIREDDYPGAKSAFESVKSSSQPPRSGLPLDLHSKSGFPREVHSQTFQPEKFQGERIQAELFRTERFQTEKFQTEKFHTEKFQTERFPAGFPSSVLLATSQSTSKVINSSTSKSVVDLTLSPVPSSSRKHLPEAPDCDYTPSNEKEKVQEEPQEGSGDVWRPWFK